MASLWRAYKHNIMDIDNESLIEAVKQRFPLWYMHNELYKNRNIKPGLWRDILMELNLEENADNIKNVKKKWDGLRSSYYRSKQSDESSKKPYKYFEKLKFLDENNPRRTTIPNMNEMEFTENVNTNKRNRLDEDIAESLTIKRECLEAFETPEPIAIYKTETPLSAASELSDEDHYTALIKSLLERVPEDDRLEIYIDILSMIKKKLKNVKNK